MRLDPKKLMVNRDLHSGYIRHEEASGRQTYSVEVVEQHNGALVYFEAVTSQASAIARASQLAECFAHCEYVGQVGEPSHVP